MHTASSTAVAAIQHPWHGLRSHARCRPHARPSCPEAQRGGFWSYVAGTAYRLLVSHQISGLVLDNHRTTLPMSKGLSSSAAICVMVSRRYLWLSICH